MQRESVARAARPEPERAGGADERLGDFVHRAVAANGDHPTITREHGVARELSGVTRAFRRDEVRMLDVRGNEIADRAREARPLPGVPGIRIEEIGSASCGER